MITYEVPLAIYPKTYNDKSLMYVALASQKNHMAVYLCGLYCMARSLDRFKAKWRGRKLDMGASCVRFRKIDDLDVDAIGEVNASTAVGEFVAAGRK